jgi:hypothetical protein
MGCKAALDAERWLASQESESANEPMKSQWNAS